MKNSYDFFPAAMEALDNICNGMTRTAACDAADITIPAFEEYIASSEELQQMLVDAERRGHDAMADALASIHNHHIYQQSDPKMAKVISDNLKFLLERRDRKRFGVKTEVTHTITADKAIIEALQAGRARAEAYLPPPTPPTIDAEFVEVEDEDEEDLSFLS